MLSTQCPIYYYVCNVHLHEQCTPGTLRTQEEQSHKWQLPKPIVVRTNSSSLGGLARPSLTRWNIAMQHDTSQPAAAWHTVINTQTHACTHTPAHTHTLSHQVSGTNSSSHPDTNNHNTPSLCLTLSHSAHAMTSVKWYKLRITHRDRQIQHILSLSHFDGLSTHCGLRWKVGSHTDQQMRHTLCLTLVD